MSNQGNFRSEANITVSLIQMSLPLMHRPFRSSAVCLHAVPFIACTRQKKTENFNKNCPSCKLSALRKQPDHYSLFNLKKDTLYGILTRFHQILLLKQNICNTIKDLQQTRHNHNMLKNNLKTPGFCSFLATSFLGAFNDNCFKLMLTCCAMQVLSLDSQKTYVPLAGLLFALPYLLCSNYAGWLSDRYRKSSICVWAKWLELAVMLLGLFFFSIRAVWPLLAVLFLMGAQSAMYSPAKYGYLPETLTQEELSRGNGLTQLCTFIAIIAGTWAGGAAADANEKQWWLGGLYCVMVAAAGIGTSYIINKTPVGNQQAAFQINPAMNHIATWKIVRKYPQLVMALFGNTFFWFVAALYQNNLPMHIKYVLNRNDNTSIGYVLGAVGIGIGLGAAACGMLSGRRIGYHLIIPGGMLMGAACIFAGLFGNTMCTVIIASGMLGFFAGMYQLPLSTAVQKHSPPSHRGSCLALGNGIDCISMILAYLVQWILLKPLGASPSGIFITLGIITLIYVTYLAFKAPFLLKRTHTWKH